MNSAIALLGAVLCVSGYFVAYRCGGTHTEGNRKVIGISMRLAGNSLGAIYFVGMNSIPYAALSVFYLLIDTRLLIKAIKLR